MSIGHSGRIVIEVDPSLKRELYAALSLEGLTLKDWFVRQAGEFVLTANQLPLRFSAADAGEVVHSAGQR
jgi:hypothetical protein